MGPTMKNILVMEIIFSHCLKFLITYTINDWSWKAEIKAKSLITHYQNVQ